ncbi:MAG: hypothetical protein PVH68_05630 [Armatimonadota bacterium]|jgi:hypothetical protein
MSTEDELMVGTDDNADEEAEERRAVWPCPEEGCDYVGGEHGHAVHYARVHAEPEPEREPEPTVVPRQRGTGPTCEKCGSGMTGDGTSRNHPFHVIRYYKCLSPDCDGYTKTVSRQ